MIVQDAKKILTIGYSAWALYALALITLAPTVLLDVFGLDTNPLVWGWLQLAAIVFGLVGRLIDQPREGRWVRRGVIGALVLALLAVSTPALAQNCEAEIDTEAVTVDLIAKWEGKRNHAYRDIVGVVTICYGHTRTARMGQYRTDAECRALLLDEVRVYRTGVHRYYTDRTRAFRLTPWRDAAYTSLGYNVGVDRAGRSTAMRRLNKGDIRGGCKAIAWWNRAGGHVVRGLTNRRTEEVEYCLRGLI